MDIHEDLDLIPTLLEHKTEEPVLSRVPLTIITGFLGAGKSTLLRRILSEKHGYRIAVIMNEFGDTADIEAKTINIASPSDPMAAHSEEFLELSNGCLCCSIKNSGIAAIEKLMQRKGAFDYILLETTGLADPGPIASMLWQNEEFSAGLGRDICLDGVVCIVDAVFGKQEMEDGHTEDGIGESLRQVACADVILLNKADLVPDNELNAVEQLIRNVNPSVPIYRTIKAEIAMECIVNIGAYTDGRQFQNKTIHYDQHHVHDHSAETLVTHHGLRGISSVQVICPMLSSQQLEKLDEWIRTVLWDNRLPDRDLEHDLKILRCKGFFVLDSKEQYVLQGVQNLYEISRLDDQEAASQLVSGKLVLIGKGLDETVRQSLQDVVKLK